MLESKGVDPILSRACAELNAGTVEALELGMKHIGDAEASMLAEALHQNRSLKYLNLRVRCSWAVQRRNHADNARRAIT